MYQLDPPALWQGAVNSAAWLPKLSGLQVRKTHAADCRPKWLCADSDTETRYEHQFIHMPAFYTPMLVESPTVIRGACLKRSIQTHWGYLARGHKTLKGKGRLAPHISGNPTKGCGGANIIFTSFAFVSTSQRKQRSSPVPATESASLLLI